MRRTPPVLLAGLLVGATATAALGHATFHERGTPAPLALTVAAPSPDATMAPRTPGPSVSPGPAVDVRGARDFPLLTSGVVVVILVAAGWAFTRAGRRPS